MVDAAIHAAARTCMAQLPGPLAHGLQTRGDKKTAEPVDEF